MPEKGKILLVLDVEVKSTGFCKSGLKYEEEIHRMLPDSSLM